MEVINRIITVFCVLLLIFSCKNDTEKTLETLANKTEKSVKKIKEKLLADGFQVFDYVDKKTGDTVIMQKYFIVFLKKGPNRSQPEEEAKELQNLHQAHLGKMYELGYADISGPMGDDSNISGITVYNTPTQKIADSLANSDPMVKAGHLVIEIHPWWAAKGFSLR